eukprot:2005210-Amphidinium_carterae.2
MAATRDARISRLSESIMSPMDIFFTHNSISEKFKCGRPIEQTYLELLSNKISIEDIPMIQVALEYGKYWTYTGNRRLWVFRKLHCTGLLPKVKVQIVQRSIPRWRFTTQNNGVSVRVRRVIGNAHATEGRGSTSSSKVPHDDGGAWSWQDSTNAAFRDSSISRKVRWQDPSSRQVPQDNGGALKCALGYQDSTTKKIPPGRWRGWQDSSSGRKVPHDDGGEWGWQDSSNGRKVPHDNG